MGTCPVSTAYDLLGKKCVLHIVRSLSTEQPKRFKQFMAELGGVSSKTLSERLRELEARGILLRRAYNEIPPRVEYYLTPMGEDLVKALKGVDTWAEKWKG